MSRKQLGASWSAAFRIILAPVIGLLIASAGLPPEAGAAEPGSQCIGCHTDPARLQALTPPDPPSTEEGEG